MVYILRYPHCQDCHNVTLPHVYLLYCLAPNFSSSKKKGLILFLTIPTQVVLSTCELELVVARVPSHTMLVMVFVHLANLETMVRLLLLQQMRRQLLGLHT